jgi:hypothetical protein
MSTWMDLAFTAAVKAAQTRRGSREAYARKEEKGSTATEIDAGLGTFIAEVRSFFLATANAEGQNIAAAHPVSCACLINAPLRSPISPAIGNTSRPEISPRIRER